MAKEKRRQPVVLIALNHTVANATKEDNKIKISPVGDIKGVDGRVYHLDAQSVIKRTQERGVDLVLNVNHGWDSYGHKAAGWIDINSLEVQEDGIYASFELTSIGKELIDERLYRYLSPEYRVARNNETMEVLELAGVGLINRPNVLNDALNDEDLIAPKSANDTSTQKETSVPREKEHNGQDPLEALRAENEALKAQNEKLEKQAKEARIDAAIAAGKLMPNKKEFAMQLNGETLESFMKVEEENMQHLQQHLDPDDAEEHNAVSNAEKEVRRQLGLSEEV